MENLLYDPIKLVEISSVLSTNSEKYETQLKALVNKDTHQLLRTVGPQYQFRSLPQLMGLFTPLVQEGLITPPKVEFSKSYMRVTIQSEIVEQSPDYGSYLTLMESRNNQSTSIGLLPYQLVCSNMFASTHAGMDLRAAHTPNGELSLLENWDVIKKRIAEIYASCDKFLLELNSKKGIGPSMLFETLWGEEYTNSRLYAEFLKRKDELEADNSDIVATDYGLNSPLAVTYTQLTNFLSEKYNPTQVATRGTAANKYFRKLQEVLN